MISFFHPCARGVATRIGNMWGAVMAGKREREVMDAMHMAAKHENAMANARRLLFPKRYGEGVTPSTLHSGPGYTYSGKVVALPVLVGTVWGESAPPGDAVFRGLH